MTCELAANLIPLQLDGELDALQSEELDRHIATCENCRALRDSQTSLSSAIQTGFAYEPAPADLVRRIEASTVAQSKPTPRLTLWKFPAGFATGLAAGLVVCLLLLQGNGGKRDAFAAELVDSHVRSLMSTDLVDVKSSDRHTVKPWFQGKLDFSPGVVDLAKEGFPLIGGRIESLDGRPAASIVYRRNKHIISLFATDDPAFDPPSGDRKGFHLKRFQVDGINYWAVCDVNPADLNEFAADFTRAVGTSSL